MTVLAFHAGLFTYKDCNGVQSLLCVASHLSVSGSECSTWPAVDSWGTIRLRRLLALLPALLPALDPAPCHSTPLLTDTNCNKKYYCNKKPFRAKPVYLVM